MRAQMTQWKGQYAPWIEDPDEDQELMSEEEIAQASKNVAKSLEERKPSIKPWSSSLEDILQNIMKRFGVTREEAQQMVDMEM